MTLHGKEAVLFINLLSKELTQGISEHRGFQSWAPVSGCIKPLKIAGTCDYYFKTIGYCFRTKVKSPLILRRFYVGPDPYH